MKFAIILALVSMAVTAPPSVDEPVVVTEKFYPENFAIYTAEHNIVDIVIPLNNINFFANAEDLVQSKITFFFVEADIKDNGKKEYKGVYVYKNGVAKKVLDNGQCSTYAKNRTIYIGASDGIYKYNENDQTATKHGTVTDNIVRLGVDSRNGNVYYLTSDCVLYKFNEDEKVATKVEAVKDARDIAFDFDGTLFYYDGKHQLYAYNGERVLKIEGLPAHPSKVELIRPVDILDDKIFAVIDGRLYTLSANGTSEKEPVKFEAQPTAFAPDALLYQYYAYNQKLYVYDLLALMKNKTIEELNVFFEDNEEEINDFKTKKVSHKL